MPAKRYGGRFCRGGDSHRTARWVATAAIAMGMLDAQAQSPDLRLTEAVRRQDAVAVQHLLDAPVDVNAAQPDGATALHWAAYVDDLEMARLLVEAGGNAGAANTHGVVPLALACTNANAAMVDLLLAAGADAAAAVRTGETVLMSCARTGNAAAVTALLDHGADVDAAESAEDQTALMWAVARAPSGRGRACCSTAEPNVHRRSRVRRLVISRRLQSNLRYGELGRRYGTDAEETDIGGYTALLFAARHGDVASARLLLRRRRQRQRHRARRAERAPRGGAQRPSPPRRTPPGRGRQPERCRGRLHGAPRRGAAGRSADGPGAARRPGPARTRR